VAGIFVRRQVDSLRQLGVTVDVRVTGRAGGRGWPQRVAWLREEVKRGRYDLVHAQYGGRTALAAILAGGPPVVISFCGSDLNGLGTGTAHERAYAGAGVLCSQLAAPHARGLIAKSEALASRFWRERDRKRCRVIPNGIDLELFRPIDRREARARLGWPADEAVALVSGQSDGPVKRLDLAEAAVERARAQVPGLSLRVLRGIPPDEVPTHLNAADLVLLTSQHEGSPNIVKEALACNVAVVSVDVGDVRRWISGTPNCWLCDRDPASLAEGIVRAVAGGGRSEGRAVIAPLALGGVAARVLDVYQEALGIHHGAECLLARR
jgi:glycosyltransferase involved in cell wall biosynthesis